ncbi:AI-2E family transporter [Gayadomonas joobiniege]|uniref:AI-2E family transporter n=1 Tax=Gayadomonas joobiniege TaxID=1234606 RepID=UPI00036E48E2|nr:AI-2E family transporter [Gayadomonas joobiniege]
MSISNHPAFRLFVVLAAIVIILAGLKSSQQIVVPFLMSVFIAIICHPAIVFLAKFRVPKVLAVSIVIALIIIVGFSLAGLVGTSINNFTENLPEYKEKLQGEITWLTNKLAEFNIFLDRKQLMEYLDPGSLMSVASNMLTGLGNALANIFLILLTTVFMLLEAGTLRKKIYLAWEDAEAHDERIKIFLNSVNNYLAIKTLVSIGTGLLAAALCWAVGVDYAVLWGVVAFLFNYIPNIGSIFAAIPVVLLTMIQINPYMALVVAIGYLLINTIMGNMVEPRYMGKGLGLSTLVVFLSLVFWGWLLGTVGMLLSVPLTMIVKIAAESSRSTNWFAVLLANQKDVKQHYQD